MQTATLNWDATVVPDDPDEQVAITIELMSDYVRADAQSPEVVAEAEIAAPAGAGPLDILDGIFHHVKHLIQFQHDEDTASPLRSKLLEAGLGDYPVVEVLIRPRDMITWRGDTRGGQPKGDCDDYAMLTAALVLAKGMGAKFVTVAADPRLPGQWSHVYVVAYPEGGERVAMDTSHGGYPGWEAQNGVTRRQEWDIDAGLEQWLVIGLVVWAVLARYLKRKRGTTL